ncbi:MAG: hypothetical protein K0M45_06765, partial [Candidatus Paracaedibacteraceae bacterium]|nr:hypothetical protein [Candidatus Paracaedibacteraceae bacterium]
EGILSSEQQDKFHTIFKENATFYKFRFYKAIFNSKKDEETKLRLLRSWIQENADREVSLTNYILKGPLSSDRPWKPITERTLHWLPNQLEGFIESHRESGESYLTSLWRQFNSGIRTATISSTIAGMGGVGKTSLALAYAHEALENKGYHLIYWLLSETESSLLKGYRDLLERINVPYNDEDDALIMELIKEHLPSQGKCLLIYDNVPDHHFLEGKAPEASHIDILITSRWSQGWGGELIDLAVFSPEDSVKYLLQTIGLEETPGNRAKAGDLAEELGHLPLALSHAAHYLKLVGGEDVSGDIISKYIKKFRRTPIGHFERRQNPFESNSSAINYEHLIARTFQMSREKLSDLAQQLMIYCAYLDPDTIVEEIFLLGLKEEIPQKDIQEALEQLSDYSLIKKRDGNAIFNMHRLLQFVILNEQERNKKQTENLARLKIIFNEVNLTAAQNYVLLGFSSQTKGLELINLHESLGKYKINLERVINHCKDLKIDKNILDPYQVIHRNINRNYYASKERIFKLKNELLENSLEEVNAITVLGKELAEGGLILDIEKCRIIFRLISQNSQQSDRLRIAKALSQMGLSQCQEFVENFKLLVTPGRSGNELATLITAFAKVEANQRQSVVKVVKQLLTADMRVDDQASIIAAFTQVKAGQEQDVAEAVEHLFTPDMRVDDQASIITAFAQVKAGQEQDVAEAVEHLFTPSMSGHERVTIITALAQVEAAQRQDIINNVEHLFTPSMRGHERVTIITALAQVEAAQRQDVTKAVEHLFTPGMNGHERASIITTLAQVETDQLQNFIDSVKQLFTSGMSGHERASIITALVQVEAAQWQDIINNVEHLFTPEMSGHERASIITA